VDREGAEETHPFSPLRTAFTTSFTPLRMALAAAAVQEAGNKQLR
jgi:hypothetical protein